MKGVLPVYDFTQDYRDHLQDENIGSDKWRYRLGFMSKPQGDGKDGAEVAHLVEAEEANKVAEWHVIDVGKRSLGVAQGATTLQISTRTMWLVARN